MKAAIGLVPAAAAMGVLATGLAQQPDAQTAAAPAGAPLGPTRRNIAPRSPPTHCAFQPCSASWLGRGPLPVHFLQTGPDVGRGDGRHGEVVALRAAEGKDAG